MRIGDGVHNIEMQHAHLPSTELSYLKSFRERLAKTKSQVTNINLEFGPQILPRPIPRCASSRSIGRKSGSITRPRSDARASW